MARYETARDQCSARNEIGLAMDMITRLAAASAILLAYSSMVAQSATLTANAFNFDGSTIAVKGANSGTASPVAASWNPTASRPGEAGSPSARIAFFGRPSGCGLHPHDGDAGPLTPAQIAVLRAESLPLQPGGTVWSPLPGPMPCQQTPDSPPGPAFVTQSATGGGMQMFAAVGPSGTSANAAFFQQYDATGQGGSGNNKGIEGTYVSWHFGKSSQNMLAPWAHDPSADLKIRTQIAVPAASVETPSDPDDVNQAAQHIAVSFFNQNCADAPSHPPYCQVRISIATDLIRSTLRPGTPRRLELGHLMLDPQQGGLPVMIGPLGAAGSPTMTVGKDSVEIWRSDGPATQHGSFGRTEFVVSLSFADFRNILSEIRKKASADGSDVTPADLFGPAWSTAAAWRVGIVTTALEIHAPHPAQSTFLGAVVYDLSVGL